MRDSLRAAVVGILAMVAVAFAAVTLDSTVLDSGGAGDGPGEGGGGPVSTPGSDSAPTEFFQVPYLSEIGLVLALIACLLVVIYVAIYRREGAALIAGAIALLVALYIIAQFVTLPEMMPGPPGEGQNQTPADGADSGGGTESPFSQILIYVLVGGLVLTLIAVVITGLRRAEPPEETPDLDRSTAASVAEAAGRAADRIEEDVDVDNEVYRAWREMTQLLDVDAPSTSTPGDFAHAAADVGLGQEDVAQLTRLFEDVRYGDHEASEDYERRAVEVFRRIESRYAEEEEEA